MSTSPIPTSLCEKIRVAASSEEIARLLLEGGTYKLASRKTRAKWLGLAANRRNELGEGEC